MATLQTLPPLATKYRASQLAAIDAAIAEVLARWERMGPRFDTGWSLVGPAIAAVVADAQRDIARRADAYVPAILEDTGQDRYVPAVAESNPDALVGLTGAGYEVGDSLSTATVRAKQAVAAGQSPAQALVTAGSWLSMATTTILADTTRASESLGRYTRNAGYVRMVHGGACGRCVIQAGKWFRTNQGFLRHPRCRCTHIPAGEDVAGSWQTNPDAYFHSLNPEQQIKLMGGKANAQAVIDGADMTQIINAYGRSSGMQFAQVSPIKRKNGLKYTTSGTTRRAQAAQQQAGMRRNGPLQMRLMPESIAMRATSPEDRIRLLEMYGWISNPQAAARGRAMFAEQRRVERNARARARRAERRTP